ncbi:hypothetical protein, conserved [Leishmania donovani]|uniref:Uncharacterized protein n=1 Tax=Leishmania donovani TaxID=5661 RepID=E9BKV7_LEIDO|nr:hypothetical protein, conserved [Leishmania donovani]CBZ35885.1 hypothetical protein, conserved [Leishmania donovani]
MGRDGSVRDLRGAIPYATSFGDRSKQGEGVKTKRLRSSDSVDVDYRPPSPTFFGLLPFCSCDPPGSPLRFIHALFIDPLSFSTSAHAHLVAQAISGRRQGLACPPWFPLAPS